MFYRIIEDLKNRSDWLSSMMKIKEDGVKNTSA